MRSDLVIFLNEDIFHNTSLHEVTATGSNLVYLLNSLNAVANDIPHKAF